MKILPNISFAAGGSGGRPGLPARRMSVAGFTLIEIMVVSFIFVFIVLGMVAVQIFGLRVYTLAATKLMATTDGRETMNAMRDQIRSANQVYVGTFSNSVFTQAAGVQTGNALQLFTAPGSSGTYTIFYQDPTKNTVYSFLSSAPSTKTVLAQYMTNNVCFQAEDYQGNILNSVAGYKNSTVITVTLNFSQWEYPIGYASGSTNGANAYDYYYLRTRINRRCKQ